MDVGWEFCIGYYGSLHLSLFSLLYVFKKKIAFLHFDVTGAGMFALKLFWKEKIRSFCFENKKLPNKIFF